MTIDERFWRLRRRTRKLNTNIKLLHREICEFGEWVKRQDQQEQASLVALRARCAAYLDRLRKENGQ